MVAESMSESDQPGLMNQVGSRGPVYLITGCVVPGQLSLTQSQLESRLFAIDKASPIGLTAVTEPKMHKLNNPFVGRVLKISRVNGFIGWRYSRAVNRQRTREHKTPDFTAEPRGWGQRIKGTPLVALVTDEGRTLLYLEVKVQTRTEEYRDRHTGEPVEERELRKFLIPPAKSHTQALNRDVVLRDYRTDHIAELRIDAQIWRNRKCWNQLQKLTRSLFSGAAS